MMKFQTTWLIMLMMSFLIDVNCGNVFGRRKTAGRYKETRLPRRGLESRTDADRRIATPTSMARKQHYSSESKHTRKNNDLSALESKVGEFLTLVMPLTGQRPFQDGIPLTAQEISLSDLNKLKESAQQSDIRASAYDEVAKNFHQAFAAYQSEMPHNNEGLENKLTDQHGFQPNTPSSNNDQFSNTVTRSSETIPREVQNSFGEHHFHDNNQPRNLAQDAYRQGASGDRYPESAFPESNERPNHRSYDVNRPPENYMNNQYQNAAAGHQLSKTDQKRDCEGHQRPFDANRHPDFHDSERQQMTAGRQDTSSFNNAVSVGEHSSIDNPNNSGDYQSFTGEYWHVPDANEQSRTYGNEHSKDLPLGSHENNRNGGSNVQTDNKDVRISGGYHSFPEGYQQALDRNQQPLPFNNQQLQISAVEQNEHQTNSASRGANLIFGNHQRTLNAGEPLSSPEIQQFQNTALENNAYSFHRFDNQPSGVKGENSAHADNEDFAKADQRGGGWSENNAPIPPQGNYKEEAEDGSMASIPGIGGKDYPNYLSIPKTKFDCRQYHPGYFADVEAQCQVYHICQDDGRYDSFLCPVGTLFNQQVLTCDWWYNIDCSSSSNYYSQNFDWSGQSNSHGNSKGYDARQLSARGRDTYYGDADTNGRGGIFSKNSRIGEQSDQSRNDENSFQTVHEDGIRNQWQTSYAEERIGSSGFPDKLDGNLGKDGENQGQISSNGEKRFGQRTNGFNDFIEQGKDASLSIENQRQVNQAENSRRDNFRKDFNDFIKTQEEDMDSYAGNRGPIENGENRLDQSRNIYNPFTNAENGLDQSINNYNPFKNAERRHDQTTNGYNDYTTNKDNVDSRTDQRQNEYFEKKLDTSRNDYNDFIKPREQSLNLHNENQQQIAIAERRLDRKNNNYNSFTQVSKENSDTNAGKQEPTAYDEERRFEQNKNDYNDFTNMREDVLGLDDEYEHTSYVDERNEQDKVDHRLVAANEPTFPINTENKRHSDASGGESVLLNRDSLSREHLFGFPVYDQNDFNEHEEKFGVPFANGRQTNLHADSSNDNYGFARRTVALETPEKDRASESYVVLSQEETEIKPVESAFKVQASKSSDKANKSKNLLVEHLDLTTHTADETEVRDDCTKECELKSDKDARTTEEKYSTFARENRMEGSATQKDNMSNDNIMFDASEITSVSDVPSSKESNGKYDDSIDTKSVDKFTAIL